MHIRLVIMPTVVTFLAVRAGLKDAREGRPAFLWAILSNRAERRRLFHSALRDIGKVLIMALVLDTVYQLFVLKEFHIFQALIVAVACAIVPYIAIRGPVMRLTRRFRGMRVTP